MYAGAHRGRLLSLTFIGGTLGLGEWAPPLKAVIRTGINPFIPVTVEQFEQELALLLVRVPEMSPEAKRTGIQPYQEHLGHHRQIWDIVGLYHSTLVQLPVNRVPTLAVWGRQHRVFDVGEAQLLARAFPNSRVVRVDGAGHLAMLDAPDAVASEYLGFLGRLRAQPQMEKGR